MHAVLLLPCRAAAVLLLLPCCCCAACCAARISTYLPQLILPLLQLGRDTMQLRPLLPLLLLQSLPLYRQLIQLPLLRRQGGGRRGGARRSSTRHVWQRRRRGGTTLLPRALQRRQAPVPPAPVNCEWSFCSSRKVRAGSAAFFAQRRRRRRPPPCHPVSSHVARPRAIAARTRTPGGR